MKGRVPVLASVGLGVFFGLSGFTFFYAEGISYFSKDPRACVNCHIMRDQYDSWQKASHHGFASCVECHLPHEPVAKYMAKAKNGYFHSKGFTLQDFHEPIRIKPENRAILEENCLRCHDAMVEEIVQDGAPVSHQVDCIRCHASVGHGAMR